MFPAAATEGNKSLADLSAESRITTLMDKVVIELNANRHDAALQLLDEADAITPDDPTLRNARAATLIQKSEYDNARTILQALLEENPRFFQADYNLGEILFLQGDYQAALTHFQRMQNIHGSTPLLRFKRLLCEVLLDDNVASEITLRTFRYPGDAPAWYFAQAVMALHKGERNKARQLMDTATRIHGTNATTLYVETINDSKLNK